MDPSTDNQPFCHNNVHLIVNGEIFNYLYLKYKYKHHYTPYTNSDCEVILALYCYYTKGYTTLLSRDDACQLVSELDGQFSFILYDDNNKTTLVARDPFGITALYQCITVDNELMFASELKVFPSTVTDITMFPAGTLLLFNPQHATLTDDLEDTLHYINYYEKCISGNWITTNELHPDADNLDTILRNVRYLLISAVSKRMMSDVPFGVLLSGGLDSSLVASITAKYMESPANLHTFSIGLENAPDVIKARIVATYIGSTHHEYTFTIDEAFGYLQDVIYSLETYDITTIRASTPMWLLARFIKELGFKMVLSGEGSDELLGGYLYFHSAPSDAAHLAECKKRLLQLPYFDCLRADKSTMAHGVEVRVPFLDLEFVNYCINIPVNIKCNIPHYANPLCPPASAAVDTDPNATSQTQTESQYDDINLGDDITLSRDDETIAKHKMEKWVLRTAFTNFLPDEILWRQKEQFSDGVGYSWIDYLRTHTATLISDKTFNSAAALYPYNTPTTKEAYYYREIYENLFGPQYAKVVKKWIPNTEWTGITSTDPSGRALPQHTSSTTGGDFAPPLPPTTGGDFAPPLPPTAAASTTLHDTTLSDVSAAALIAISDDTTALLDMPHDATALIATSDNAIALIATSDDITELLDIPCNANITNLCLYNKSD
jgi:asparagine synthase (glutamine-hydrolysing)